MVDAIHRTEVGKYAFIKEATSDTSALAAVESELRAEQRFTK
jgi:hypothetical protein